MSPTLNHLLGQIGDLPGEAGVEVTVRGVFGARMTFGTRAGTRTARAPRSPPPTSTPTARSEAHSARAKRPAAGSAT